MLQFNPKQIAKNRKNSHMPRRSANKRQGVKKRGRDADLAKRKAIASEVKLYLEDHKIGRPKFEEKLRRSESTINHFFAGDYSDALLARIEYVLGRKFDQSSAVAPAEWGGYTRESTTKLVGSFLTLRNDFDNSSRICAFVTSIEWGPIEQAHIFDGQLVRKPKVDGYELIFREEKRPDPKHTHRGQVWVPGGQYLYLISAYGDGRLRAAIVSLPDDDMMTGIQLSLYNPKGAAFTPAAAPIAFVRREKINVEELGYIIPGHAIYESYRQILIEAMDGVVMAMPSNTP